MLPPSLKSLLRPLLLIVCLLALFGCENNMVIINDVEEREANEIIVYLASKNIKAQKMPSPTTGGAAATQTEALWSISVEGNEATEAMSILNQIGLPRKKGTNLLELFGKAGLISTEKEETIRYQAGLAAQIAGMIRKIDGVIDADVQLSIPPTETGPPTPGTVPQRVTAAVYVKHQGILDDPNSHLITKIKRLVAGSVNGLDINDVTVISDRSRFTDVSLMPQLEQMAPKNKEYVSIWSIVMNKSSASRLRTLFFILITATIVFGLGIAWLIWKFYPVLRKKGGIKELFHPIPIDTKENSSQEGKK